MQAPRRTSASWMKAAARHSGCVFCRWASCRSETSCCPRRSRWKAPRAARSQWPRASSRMARSDAIGFFAELTGVNCPCTSGGNVLKPNRKCALRREPILEQLFARFSQCGLQLLLLLFPPRFLVFDYLFDLRTVGFDDAASASCFSLALSRAASSLRDRLLPTLAFPPPGSFFPQAFGFTPLLFALELQRCGPRAALSLIFGGRRLFALERVLSRLAPTSSPPRSVGKSASSESVRSSPLAA